MTTSQRLLLSTTAIAGSFLLAAAPALAQTPTPTQSTLPPNTPAEAEVEAQDAQDSVSPGESGATEVGEVIVTGSRIPRPQFEGVIPGSQVEQAEIERRAFVNALDVLSDVPLVGFGTALNTNGGQPSSLGVGFVDLLDLGTQRTLTLVNGRRFVSGNAASLFVADNATGSQVDVTSIPVSLIDRVDVLTVGGAAAYGSDAIAGVVNYILRDDFEGTELSAVGGITSRSDAGNYSLRGLAGRNYFDDRLNLTLSYEYNYIDSLTGAERDFRANRPNSVTNFAQGSARNAAFNRNALATGSNTAFLPGASDLIPGTVFLPNTRNTLQSPGGTVFQATANQAGVPGNSIGPVSSPLLATNTQLVLGVPLTANNTVGVPNAAGGNPFGATGNPLSTFAPTALPAGVTPAQVFTAFGATPPAGSTAAQQTALAVQILQANRPTPREYLAANPNVPLNAFLGTFIAPLPDVPNTDPATNRFLPRIAVPLRFDQNGNLETFTVARLDNPGTPGQLERAPNSDGYNDQKFGTLIRVEQKRNLGNFFGRFTINDNIEFFTENLFADVRARAPFSLGGLTNSASGSTVENAPLVINVNNPFLDAADRATLASVGITSGNFVLGRTNEDILGDNPSKSEVQTLRSSNGFRGNFDLLNRKFNYEASATYGKVEAEVTQGALLDVEYALALDAVRDPATGNIVCRARLNPGEFLGRSPTGVFDNVIRPIGSDGIRREQIFRPTVTQAQIDACQPLNPFGVNQMSQAAKDYVRTQNVYENTSEQLFLQSFISSTLFELPGGPLDYSVSGEYREDELEFTTNPINQAGRTRSAPSAQTQGKTETVEYGIELRIPIFGEGFNFPLLRSLELNPAVRWSQQDGKAPAYRNLAGQLVSQDSDGDRERIEQLAVTYRPFEDLLLRGNVTSSIRQPSVTELFLGGQPSFINAFTDPCSSANINSGPVPATRRRNCEAAAARAGFAANLPTFIPTGAPVQGVFAGSSSLSAEKADSWTAGFVFEPRFVPGLQASLDYIVVDLEDQIVPTNLTQALQFCYDSATENDTTAQFGANTCAFFSRDPSFNVQSGFTSGFLNLSATQIKAWNAAVNYEFDIADLVSYIRPTEADLGEIDFRFSGYHLVKFATSAAGDFSDTQRSEGDIFTGRPEYETQFRTLYTRGPFDLSYTVNYASSTRIFTGGVPNTIEQTSIIEIEPSLVQNVTVGYEFDERIRAQLTVDNITDETTYGGEGYLAGPGFTGYIDQLGRRFTATVRAKF